MKEKGKKAGYFLYAVIALALCLLPLAAIGVRGETDFSPAFFDEEGFRFECLQETGDYFNEHFAFRPELISLDAKGRTMLFSASPVSDVIVGEDGWLYYAATLDDFQHKNPVSERMLFNMAHNVALMQRYTESLGMEFLFTIAPNKNSLYGENMPKRFAYQVEQQSDAERLSYWLEREQVNYVDLYDLFRRQDEILYYRKDSHWNEKGAVMVYNALLDACGREHETYADSKPQASGFYGDLDRMLFPVGARPEADMHYAGVHEWKYSQGETVEDNLIITECAEGDQTLLMYRDSFGNSLLPFFAGEFSQAVFSKRVPYPMTDLATYWPDFVIIERVERHLPTLGKVPPQMSAPEIALAGEPILVESAATVKLSKEGSFWKLQGAADRRYMSDESRIFVEITDADGTKIYEAFCTSVAGEDSNDYGYTLYLSEIQVTGSQWNVAILTQQDGKNVVLREETVDLTE